MLPANPVPAVRFIFFSSALVGTLSKHPWRRSLPEGQAGAVRVKLRT